MVNSIPVPAPTPDTVGFWAALKEHELRVPHCSSCDSYFFPPMPGCPECGAGEQSVELRAVSGKGRVHSWFVAHHAFHPAFEAEVPYVVLDVHLDEGPRINGRLLGFPADQIVPGMAVEAHYEDLPQFTRLAFTASAPEKEARR